MSFTTEPPGSRPSCPSCGGFNWAFDGWCHTLECAGHYKDPDYPKSMPQWMKDAKAEAAEAKGAKTTRKPAAKKVKMPRKGQRRSMELWYESQGKTAPWLERKDDEHEHA